MWKKIHLVVAFVVGLVIWDVSSAAIVKDSEQFDTLLARIELLEASDVANKAKIAEMESDFKEKMTEYELEISDLKIKMEEMESKFVHKEALMLNEINELKTALTASNGDGNVQALDENNDKEQRLPVSNRIQRRLSNLKQNRASPETEVAFYATHFTHEIHHLGSKQIIQFPNAITNVGNAFNTNTGGFTVPVDGTYVIHATVMGIDVSTSPGNHMRAYFDVDGAAYSVFWVSSYDQSSQMLVIDLKAGQTVTVRNDYADTGYVGDHHSSFSGFLLYQHYPSGAVIGK